MSKGSMPTKVQIAKARRAIKAEDRRAERLPETPEYKASVAENQRRSLLLSEHPDHICSLRCDGQDGPRSYCARLRRQLFDRQEPGKGEHDA